MPKRLIQQSDVVMAHVLEDYQNPTMTSQQIADKHGISTATITVWVKKAGMKLRKQGRKKAERPTPQQMEVLKQASVLKYDQVGLRFGCSKQAIHRVVSRWRNWMPPGEAPFAAGDIVTWRGKTFTVLSANQEDGTLRENKTGMLYTPFVWGGGIMPKKIGFNPHALAAARN